MPQVIAIATGYYGAAIRSPGKSFYWDDKEWNDKNTKRPSWAVSVKSKAADDMIINSVQQGATPVNPQGAQVIIPPNWAQLSEPDRLMLAGMLAGNQVTDTVAADHIVSQYLSDHPDNSANQPFGDAPVPETVVPASKTAKSDPVVIPPQSQAADINSATGEGPTGDWVDPNTGEASPAGAQKSKK